ncbi:LysR family transcriptional regulator [Candidatus Dojkabacteria bacterium]|nr:LysR family transcriptional regulator [Candidatus Dojkabacteria bacterium]
MFYALQNFQKVVEIGNLTKASQELHLSQPALTISIKKLEKRLGCKLLIRSRSGVVPTKFGNLVYDYAKRMKTDFNNLRAKIAEENRAMVLNIRMGMIDNLGLLFVSKIYKRFLDHHKNIHLQIQVNNSEMLIEEVEKGTIDFAIITKGTRKFPLRIIQKKFISEEMSLVGLPINVQNIKNLSDLRGKNFISYNQNSTTHKLIDTLLKKKNINVNYIAYSSSPDFILQMVKQGSGLAVLPESFVIDDLRTETIKKVRLNNIRFKRQLSLIYLKSTFLPKITQKFIDELTKAY